MLINSAIPAAALAAGPDASAGSATKGGAAGVASKNRVLNDAPEFNGAKGWLNVSNPLSIKDLRGKVVLLDFWTYCCINCMHVIPKLKELEAKYPNDLVIIGVHSGKFNNEKDLDNIRSAVARNHIEHPVINDPDYAIWNAFGATAWPSYVLIDPVGKIQVAFRGENGVVEADPYIANLIATARTNKTLKPGPLKLSLESAKMSARSVLSFPGKIIADEKTKHLFIADSGHNRVVVCDADGSILQVIGAGSAGFKDGTFSTALFKAPQGLALHGDELFIADTENHSIRSANLKSKIVSTVAGTGQEGTSRHAGAPATTALNSPWDLCWYKDRLYIAMAGFNQIWTYEPASKKLELLAGSGREAIVDGERYRAMLAQPSGLSTDGKDLFVADSEVSAIRSVDLTSAKVTTLIGKGLFVFGDVDGKLQDARLQHPLAVLWHAGKLYVADSYNHKIKVIDLAGKTIKTFAGSGTAGLVEGKSARFSEPSGLAILDQTIYVADTNNGAIRTINLSTKVVSTLKIKGNK